VARHHRSKFYDWRERYGKVNEHKCNILDGFSRYIVSWNIRESMTEADIEILLQGAREKYPEARGLGSSQTTGRSSSSRTSRSSSGSR
jgi:transposase InsO family protein